MNEKSRRVQRVEKELRLIVSQFILQKLKDLSSVLYSITDVRVTGDLRSAKILVSGLNGEPDIQWLQTFAFEIQKEVSRQLRMKFCPRIYFLKDQSSERLLKVERALYEIGKNKEPDYFISQEKKGSFKEDLSSEERVFC